MKFCILRWLRKRFIIITWPGILQIKQDSSWQLFSENPNVPWAPAASPFLEDSIKTHLMSSSVTMKALQRGWDVLSQTAGFFSTAAESWPVMGAELVCKALATADNKVSSLLPGPTPKIKINSIKKQLCNNTVISIQLSISQSSSPLELAGFFFTCNSNYNSINFLIKLITSSNSSSATSPC